MKVQTEQSKFDTDEHILVCLSSSPSNARIIHTAAKMAKVLHARFTAIYVQTDTVINDEDQSRLSQNIQLAQRQAPGRSRQYPAATVSLHQRTDGVCATLCSSVRRE